MEPNDLSPWRGKYHVFLSHAGTEKRGIVSIINGKLKEADLNVFVDYESLDSGDHAPTEMENAAWTAQVGLFVLSKDFFQRDWPERELRIFLERYKKKKNAKLVPFFYKVAPWSDDSTLTREQRTLLWEVSEFTGAVKTESDFDDKLVEKIVADVKNLVEDVKGRVSSMQAGSMSAKVRSNKHFLPNTCFIFSGLCFCETCFEIVRFQVNGQTVIEQVTKIIILIFKFTIVICVSFHSWFPHFLFELLPHVSSSPASATDQKKTS